MLKNLVDRVKFYLELGVYDPEQLFVLVYPPDRSVHYATVRRAIHLAKTK